MDQPHLFAGERRGRFAQSLGLRQGSIQWGGIEFDDIILVPELNAAGERGCRRMVNIEELEPAIIADPARSGGRQLAGQRRINNLRLMARRGGRRGGWSRGWNLRVTNQRRRKPAKHGQPNCAILLYHDKLTGPAWPLRSIFDLYTIAEKWRNAKSKIKGRRTKFFTVEIR
jgi:hypothetical protein